MSHGLKEVGYRYINIDDGFDKVAGKHVSMNICRWAFPETWAKILRRRGG